MPSDRRGWSGIGETSGKNVGCFHRYRSEETGTVGKAMLFPAMVETYAILALLVSILAINAL